MINIYNTKIYKFLKNIYYSLIIYFFRNKGVPYTVNGFKFRMPVSSYKYGRFKYFLKDYEKQNFEFFRRIATKGMTCIDVGGHIGLYAVFMSKEANATVFSFEPTLTSQSVFRDMMKVNKCGDEIRLIPAAVAEKSGKARFYVIDSALFVSNSLVKPRDTMPSSSGGYDVEVVSIDEFVEKNKIQPNFIKIDAEGVELEILKGAKNTFLKYRPAGILGIHPFAYKNKTETYSEIWDKLEEYGLKMFFDNCEISRTNFMNQFSDKYYPFDLQFEGNNH